ncbi:hypothetical protein MRX96_057349 [Rhipicephalus microplus]
MAAMACVVRLETGEQKKVVRPTGSYDELVYALSAHTSVGEQTLLQAFDTEVEEYIDLEKNCTILPKSIIKVGRKWCRPLQMADFICTTELVEIHVPLRKQYDYSEFKLPAFGPYGEVLQRGEPVEGPVRQAIVNRIFQACFKIVWFSLKELYNTAVEQLIQKYPHLRDNIKKGTAWPVFLNNVQELWKHALKHKFKNNRKKTQNISEEMEAMRTINAPKMPRVPGPEEINKKLCRLSDKPELVVRGETAEGCRRHHEWLAENASTAGDDELRPHLLATAEKRHERLEHMTIKRALLNYPFLATEHSVCSYSFPFFCDNCGNCLLVAVGIQPTVQKKNILDNMMKEFECLCGMILSHGHQEEDAILGVLKFIANHCNDSLETLLTDKADTPLTPCIERATDGTLVHHADNQRLFVASSLLSAIASLFSHFWVFHIKYLKKADRVLMFIEHAFVDISQIKPKVEALELINFNKNFS